MENKCSLLLSKTVLCSTFNGEIKHSLCVKHVGLLKVNVKASLFVLLSVAAGEEYLRWGCAIFSQFQ